MDSSRRAVESYWRSRMIDGATSDDDKVTPVYKLEEICELLRSSPAGIVKELSDFILKRIDHKSPVVKKKALRLIKYVVGKSGVEFRREMQRHAVVIRQLFHYKGQLDPLKGDALNTAVRDTAHEAIAAIFAEDINKPAPADEHRRRIEGFGNTNFSRMASEDKKSFISEVVGLGSASIKQGLSSFTQNHSLKTNESGSYKSPTLHRSLTMENEYTGRYNSVDHQNERHGNFGMSKDVSSGPWNQDSRVAKTDVPYSNSSSIHSESKTLEEKLLETIVTSGGVRLQPTRDAIQVFLREAAKLDMLALSQALETKLQTPQWQVRMKAVCVLEAILRKKDDERHSIVASYFSENINAVLSCSESPQASLREKANKVLNLLGGEKGGAAANISDNLANAESTIVHQMPNLIDNNDLDDYIGTNNSIEKPSDQTIQNPTAPILPIDDLLGDAPSSSEGSSVQKNDDDPFADVCFHTSESRKHVDEIFSGITFDGKDDANENQILEKKNGPELFDVFGSNSEFPQQKDVNNLMASLSIDKNGPVSKQKEKSTGVLSEAILSGSKNLPVYQIPNNALSGILGSQTLGMDANVLFPQSALPCNAPPGVMLNQSFPSQQMNYGAMGNLISQNLTTISSFQHFQNMNAQNTGFGNVAGVNGGYSSPLPDIFQPNFPTPVQNPSSSSKKDDTRAFDFISDHVAAARDSKRVV